MPAARPPPVPVLAPPFAHASVYYTGGGSPQMPATGTLTTTPFDPLLLVIGDDSAFEFKGVFTGTGSISVAGLPHRAGRLIYRAGGTSGVAEIGGDLSVIGADVLIDRALTVAGSALLQPTEFNDALLTINDPATAGNRQLYVDGQVLLAAGPDPHRIPILTVNGNGLIARKAVSNAPLLVLEAGELRGGTAGGSAGSISGDIVVRPGALISPGHGGDSAGWLRVQGRLIFDGFTDTAISPANPDSIGLKINLSGIDTTSSAGKDFLTVDDPANVDLSGVGILLNATDTWSAGIEQILPVTGSTVNPLVHNTKGTFVNLDKAHVFLPPGAPPADIALSTRLAGSGGNGYYLIATLTLLGDKKVYWDARPDTAYNGGSGTWRNPPATGDPTTAAHRNWLGFEDIKFTPQTVPAGAAAHAHWDADYAHAVFGGTTAGTVTLSDENGPVHARTIEFHATGDASAYLIQSGTNNEALHGGDRTTTADISIVVGVDVNGLLHPETHATIAAPIADGSLYNGLLPAPTTLTKGGPGTLLLTGANRHTGDTNVGVGALIIGDRATGSLGGAHDATGTARYAGDIHIAREALLAFNEPTTTTQRHTGELSGAGTLAQFSPRTTLVLAGENTAFTGDIGIASTLAAALAGTAAANSAATGALATTAGGTGTSTTGDALPIAPRVAISPTALLPTLRIETPLDSYPLNDGYSNHAGTVHNDGILLFAQPAGTLQSLTRLTSANPSSITRVELGDTSSLGGTGTGTTATGAAYLRLGDAKHTPRTGEFQAAAGGVLLLPAGALGNLRAADAGTIRATGELARWGTPDGNASFGGDALIETGGVFWPGAGDLSAAEPLGQLFVRGNVTLFAGATLRVTADTNATGGAAERLRIVVSDGAGGTTGGGQLSVAPGTLLDASFTAALESILRADRMAHDGAQTLRVDIAAADVVSDFTRLYTPSAVSTAGEIFTAFAGGGRLTISGMEFEVRLRRDDDQLILYLAGADGAPPVQPPGVPEPRGYGLGGVALVLGALLAKRGFGFHRRRAPACSPA
ncbi:MAG: hypothetical protein LBR07_00045 [Puniceicoccales bacterium]|nr:hypothetical protein [Puniceicoccales bacterium]